MNPTSVVVGQAPPGAPVVTARPAAPRRWPHRRLGLRLASRLARRELQQRPARTLLVALLVAVPVAGITIAAVLVRTRPLSPAEEWRLVNGAADYVTTVETNGDALVDHARGRMVTIRSGRRILRTAAGRRAPATVTDLPAGHPLTDGMVVMTEGRAPATADEVLVSPSLGHDLDVGVGDRIQLDRPAHLSATVTGLGSLSADVRAPLLLLGPGLPLRHAGLPDGPGVESRTLLGVDGAVPPETAQRLARNWVPSPARVPPPAGDQGTGLITAGMGLGWAAGAAAIATAGIVVGAAFTPSARRQLTTVGLLVANGAPAPMLRRVLLLQGTITGAVGALVGLSLAAAVLTGGRPHLDRLLPMHHDGYRGDPRDIAAIVLLALVASTLAAVVPARTAERLPVRQALAGRRPVTAVPARAAGAGLVLFAGGVALLTTGLSGPAAGSARWPWLAAAAGGGVAVLLGMCAGTPAVVGQLERAAGRLPGPWRLAARSLARRRAHTSALVAAVCASAALALGASAFVAGARPADTGAGPPRIPADQVRLGAGADGELLDRVRAELPAAEIHRLQAAGDGAVVADGAAAAVYALSPSARAQLQDRGAIAVGSTPALLGPRQPVAMVSRSDAPGLDTVLVTRQHAERLGLVVRPGPVVLRNDRPLDDELRAALGDIRLSSAGAALHFDEPDPLPRTVVAEAGIAAGSFLAALLVIAVGLALVGAESRHERELLVVAGGSPRAISQMSGRKALLIVLIGTALAVPVGLLPLGIAAAAAGRAHVLAFPWGMVAVLVLVVPAAAGLVTGVASAVGQRRRHVRISTMAVD